MEGGTNRFTVLPAELREKIMEEVENFPISLDGAKVLRRDLMKERERFRVFPSENFADVVISLYEH